jgi:hypothetical protein
MLGIIHRPVFYLKHDVSGTESYLCLQVDGPNRKIYSPSLPENGDRIQSLKRRVFK